VKLPARVAGATAGPLEQEIDARWLMAYSAALGETAPAYFDTTRADGILAHPLFPVCYEWPLAVDLREHAIGAELSARSVHATHDLVLHRVPRPGDRLTTTAKVTAVESRTPGAYVVTRLATVDHRGAPVSVTEYGSLYRGVACDGDAAPRAPSPPEPDPPAMLWSETIPLAAGLAHVYTECARIWNPIHTDRAVAQAAGLPDIILHGTATLALAVTAVLRRLGAPRHVTRVRCQFRGMVALPSAITVSASAPAGPPGAEVIAFEVKNAAGQPAITRGSVALAPRASG